VRELWVLDHLTTPTITMRVMASPLTGDWVIWSPTGALPKATDQPTLEAAQRLADDLAATVVPHDCRQHRCADWHVLHPAMAEDSPSAVH
jgi:hypothetical protein